MTDAAKVEALVDVLKTRLPELVGEALRGRDSVLREFVANLSNAEWAALQRDEDQRRDAHIITPWR
jgi:hypothetical protein